MGAGASTASDQEQHDPEDTYEYAHAEPSSKDPCKFQLGDIVEIFQPNPPPLEGLVIEIIGKGKVRVECADRVHLCKVSECTLLKSADELEIGDKVEMQPPGSFLFFVGHIIQVNEDGTFDIRMDVEAEDSEPDVETNVARDLIRKIASNRLRGQFKKGGWAIVALNTIRRGSVMTRSAEEPTETTTQAS